MPHQVTVVLVEVDLESVSLSIKSDGINTSKWNIQ